MPLIKNTSVPGCKFLVHRIALALIGILLTACTASPLSQEAENASASPLVQGVTASAGDGRYQFVDAEMAGTILAQADEYTAELQSTEIGIKVQDANKTTLGDLQATYTQGALNWTNVERAAVEAAIAAVEAPLRAYDRHLPRTVLLAKTSSKVEGGLPHTRANLIAFSQNALDELVAGDGSRLQSLFLHELHHVLSRHNRDHHDDYYRLIGFEPCAFTAPPGLRARRLTNPDAPTYRHYAKVPVKTSAIKADGVIPYLSVSGPYEGGLKPTLGFYFDFGLLAVNIVDGVCSAVGEEPTLLAPPDLPAFLQLVGGNTGYIIHPEETLADNFTFLIMDRQDLPNPEIPEKIGAFWSGLE
ncbi:MAG: hypothetical protein AAGL18_07845 [Pseudomonadota bacterium]